MCFLFTIVCVTDAIISCCKIYTKWWLGPYTNRFGVCCIKLFSRWWQMFDFSLESGFSSCNVVLSLSNLVGFILLIYPNHSRLLPWCRDGIKTKLHAKKLDHSFQITLSKLSNTRPDAAIGASYDNYHVSLYITLFFVTYSRMINA